MKNYQPEAIRQKSLPVLVISVDKAGHVNQCLALCEMMSWYPDKIIRIPGAARHDTRQQKRKMAFLRRFYTLVHFLRLVLAKNLIIVASGTSPHSLVGIYQKIYGKRVFSVYAGNPKSKHVIYDVAVRSNHSFDGHSLDSLTYDCTAARTHGAKSTLLISGVPVRKLSTANHKGDRMGGIAVLIGGKNKAFEVSPTALAQQMLDYLGTRQNRQDPVYIVFSRRTSPAAETYLRNKLSGNRFHFVDRDDRVGFLQAYVVSEEFVITPDSISMISEACISGKPVRLFDLPCVDSSSSTAKFAREVLASNFAALINAGSVPLLNVLDESKTIRNFVQAAIGPWIGGLGYRQSLVLASRKQAFAISTTRVKVEATRP